MTENDLITLYCKIDDFYHSFIKTNAGKEVLLTYHGRRGPKRKLLIPEVITLNLIRQFDCVTNMKTYL